MESNWPCLGHSRPALRPARPVQGWNDSHPNNAFLIRFHWVFLNLSTFLQNLGYSLVWLVDLQNSAVFDIVFNQFVRKGSFLNPSY